MNHSEPTCRSLPAGGGLYVAVFVLECRSFLSGVFVRKLVIPSVARNRGLISTALWSLSELRLAPPSVAGSFALNVLTFKTFQRSSVTSPPRDGRS
jgi:hypothetical protein